MINLPPYWARKKSSLCGDDESTMSTEGEYERTSESQLHIEPHVDRDRGQSTSSVRSPTKYTSMSIVRSGDRSGPKATGMDILIFLGGVS